VDADLTLDPEQPEEVIWALVQLLDEPTRAPDPWWQAGNAEALET
jgi:hypothetical protein